MGSSLPPSSVAMLTTTAHERHHHLCSPDGDDYYEDDSFEFTPLLLRPRRRRSINGRTTERPRTVVHVAATTTVVIAEPQPPLQRARRGAPSIAPAPPRKQQQVRWHDMAFGSVRVPAAMDMGEIRRRLRARQQALAVAGGAGNEQPSSAAAECSWAPWRLIRSLSCKGVEAVAAAAAPVRLVYLKSGEPTERGGWQVLPYWSSIDRGWCAWPVKAESASECTVVSRE